jgi:hypothetical protein
MNINRRETNPIKRRRAWWLESGFFWVVGVLYMGSGVVGIFWVSYLAKIAAQILAVFWVVMLPVIIWLYKRTQFEPYYIDHSVVDKTVRDLATHRAGVRNEFLKTEIALLEKGGKIPVLDVWRLDEGLQSQSPFFSHIEVVAIDASQRELQIRLQIEDPPQPGGKDGSPFMKNVFEFLSVISKDSNLAAFRKYFDMVTLEIYAMQENEQEGDIAYPVLSMQVKAQTLWKFASTETKIPGLTLPGDVRFEDGRRIQSHRSIESPKLGSK